MEQYVGLDVSLKETSLCALGDASGVVYVARLAAQRGQAKVGTDTGRAPEALRIIHCRHESSGRHGANPRHGHQSATGLGGLGEPQHAPVQGDELLARRPPDFEQCLDHFNQERIAGDQLADTGFERSDRHLPQHQAKGLECAADLVGSVRMRWLSRLLTCTWRYQPVRTIWASPSASLASVLLSRNDKAALAWRASRQTTGRPSAFSACQCQVDSSPLSRPILVTAGALRARTAAMLSGVDAHLPCQRVVFDP